MESEAEGFSAETAVFKKWARPKWHRAYYLLALFDVLIVLMGLFLNHQIVSIYDRSVQVNQEWAKRLNDFSELGKLAGAVNAPGNDVFDSHDVAVESARMQDALHIFNESVITIEKDLRNELSEENNNEFIGKQDIERLDKNMEAVKRTMSEMTAEAEFIFSHFRNNQPELAGRRMATMDRKYANFRDSLNRLRENVSVIQEKLFSQDKSAAASLRKFEYLIAAFVLLMVSGATLYGRKIKNKMESGEREKERHLGDLREAETALRQAHDALEERVEERTTELAETNKTLQNEIRERERAEETLRKSEKSYRQIIENASDIIYRTDIEGRFIFVNGVASRLLKYTEDELLGLRYLELISPDQRFDAESFYQAQLKQKSESTYYEFPVIAKDGTEFWLGQSVQLATENNRIVGFQAVARDITERKRAEDALYKSEERFQLITRATNDTLWDWNLLTNDLWWSENFYSTFGYRADEVEPTLESWTSRIHPDDAERIGQEVHELIESSQTTWSGEYRFRRGDGSYATISDRAYMVHDEQGRPVRLAGSMMDITERNRVEAELQMRETQLKEAQAIAHVGSWEWDIVENKIKWTDELYRIFGLKPQEFNATFEGYLACIHPDDLELVTKTVELALQEKKFPIYDNRIVRPDGTVRMMRANGKVIVDGAGNPVKMIGIGQDITEQKKIEAEIAQARDAAVESARLKSEFLANMSHEIRTPMNGVIGMTGLLLDTELNAEQRDYTETIQSSADSLITVINDILDFSKIEAGMLHFERLDFNLRDVVEGTVELLAARAQNKGLEIASHIEGDLPTTLRGDAGRLRQVLTNLVGNAIKFTEAGEVTVHAAKESESETHVLLRFEVADTGIGVSEEAHHRLFQPFTQADGSTTRKYGGTGLGLAISKQLVELMSGEISVESRSGAGSTFYFTARLEKQPAGAATNTAPQAKADLADLRVLIVDDNATNRRIVAHQVASWGMQSRSVAEGAEAIAMLRDAAASREPFDLALLDMMMPGMDGLELAHTIKGDPTISQTQLVMLTSLTQRSDCENLRRAGLASCLTKPVKQSQLFDCLTRVMAKTGVISVSPETEGHRILPNQATRADASTNSKPVARNSARILLAEDNLINRKVALRQLEKLGYSAEAVTNGCEALNALALIPYDIVLMDCQMPEMDGYEATGEIRRREGAHWHTTIIAMTANALEGDHEKCLAAGMDDYISKPVKIEDLAAVLDRWQPNSSDGEGKTVSPVERDNYSPVDLERLWEASNGDKGEMRELTELYLRQTAEELANLDGAIKAGLTMEVKHIAHTCIGGSATCGMRTIIASLRELERMADEGRLDRAAYLLEEVEKEFDRIKLFLEENLGQITA